eukprot:scaffold69534_cov57-Phaeocystis_antarctica.AAC.1
MPSLARSCIWQPFGTTGALSSRERNAGIDRGISVAPRFEDGSYSQPMLRRNEPETQTHPSVRRYVQRRLGLPVDQEKRFPWRLGQRVVEEWLSLRGTHAICDTHVTVDVFFAVLLDAFDV